MSPLQESHSAAAGNQQHINSSAANPSPPTAGDPPRLTRHTIYVPLPPRLSWPAQAATTAATVAEAGSCSGKGIKKALGEDDDPFLAAYMKCTKSSKIGHAKKGKNMKEKVKGMRVFSCKCDSEVRDDAMIRVHERKKLMEKEGGGRRAG